MLPLENIMTEKYGKVKSVTIFDEKKKAEIVLRTDPDPTLVTLKLSNDEDGSAFGAMASVVAAGIEFGTGPPAVAPNVHVKYGSDMEIDELTLHLH